MIPVEISCGNVHWVYPNLRLPPCSSHQTLLVGRETIGQYDVTWRVCRAVVERLRSYTRVYDDDFFKEAQS